MKSVADSKIYIKTLFYNWFFGLHCFEIYDSLTDLFVHNIRKLTLYNERCVCGWEGELHASMTTLRKT